VNDAKPSKSALKRESLALQSLGEKLVQLTQSELESMQLDGALFKAVVDAKRIRSHGALRRQRQHIGKLMRNADAARIESCLRALSRQDQRAKAVFHAAEEWRDRLCAGGAPAVQQFADLIGRDPSQLRALLRDQDAVMDDATRRAVLRRVFQHVHQELLTQSASSPGPDPESER
jgi:ribosome-associated protein